MLSKGSGWGPCRRASARYGIGRPQFCELQYPCLESTEAFALRISQQRPRRNSPCAAVFPVRDDDAENLVASRADFGIHLQFHGEDPLRHGNFERTEPSEAKSSGPTCEPSGLCPNASFFATSSESIERSGCWARRAVHPQRSGIQSGSRLRVGGVHGRSLSSSRGLRGCRLGGRRLDSRRLRARSRAAAGTATAVGNRRIAPDHDRFPRSRRVDGSHIQKELRGPGLRYLRATTAAPPSAIENEVVSRLNRERFVVKDERTFAPAPPAATSPREKSQLGQVTMNFWISVHSARAAAARGRKLLPPCDHLVRGVPQ